MKIILNSYEQQKLSKFLNIVHDAADNLNIKVHEVIDTLEDELKYHDICDDVPYVCGCYNHEENCCEISWEESRCDNCHECNSGMFIPIFINGELKNKPTNKFKKLQQDVIRDSL